jgi:hypothetical protein
MIKKVIAALEWLLAIFIVLDLNSVYMRLFFQNDFYFQFGSVIIASIILLLRFFQNRDSISRNDLIVACLLLGFLMFFSVLNSTNPLIPIIYLLIPFFTLFIFVGYYFRKSFILSFLRRIRSTIVFISIISLFCYLFLTILNILPSNVVHFTWGTEITCRTFFYLYFEPQIMWFSNIKIVRNCGVFCEAPMFSFVLCTALLFELFIFKPKPFVILVLGATIITTFSTTGIIFLCCSLLLFMLKISHQFGKGTRYFIYLSFPILFFLSLFVIKFYLEDKMTTGILSYSARSDDILACIKAWINNPIFGNGMDNPEAIIEFLSPWRSYMTGLSCGLFVLLAECGLAILIPLIIIILRFATISKTNFKLASISKLSFSVLFIYLFSVTNVPTKDLTMILICIMYWDTITFPSKKKLGSPYKSTLPKPKSFISY